VIAFFTKAVWTASIQIRPYRQSVRTQQLDSHSTEFHEILHFSISRKSVEKIRVSLKSD
jgi:hypothetical protein